MIEAISAILLILLALAALAAHTLIVGPYEPVYRSKGVCPACGSAFEWDNVETITRDGVECPNCETVMLPQTTRLSDYEPP